jgi:hypothetical protein
MVWIWLHWVKARIHLGALVANVLFARTALEGSLRPTTPYPALPVWMAYQAGEDPMQLSCNHYAIIRQLSGNTGTGSGALRWGWGNTG